MTSITGFFTFVSFRCFIQYNLQARPGEDIDYQSRIHRRTCNSNPDLSSSQSRCDSYVANSHISTGRTVGACYFTSFPIRLGKRISRKHVGAQTRWKRLRLLQGIGALLSGGTSNILAVTGFGVYALILPGLLLTAPSIYDLLFVARWRPDWSFRWENFPAPWRYGISRAGAV